MRIILTIEDYIMKNAIIISLAVVAVLLGACRRQEAVPMKLGMDITFHPIVSE